MLTLIVVLLYVVGLVGVGVWKARRVRGATGFLLAGRDLGLFVLVGTLLATWTGTGSIFGNAEEAYRVGLPGLVLPFASAAGILALIVMAPKVRAEGRFTLQDLLEDRFGPAARVLGTLTLVAAYLVIVSYQLRAAGAVLDGVLDGVPWGEAAAGAAGEDGGGTLGDVLRGWGAQLDAQLYALGLAGEHGGNTAALLAVAIIITLYTALAGLMSVATTDVVNGLLMLTGVAVALPLVWWAAAAALEAAPGAAGAASGGQGVVDTVLAALPEAARRPTGHYSTFDLLSRLLPAFLLVLGDANLHQRFSSARTPGTARLAALLLIPGVLLVDGVILLTAVGGSVLMPGLAEPGVDRAGHVILLLGLEPGLLPPLLGALLVASILAIIISTADSFLLSCSASLVRDVYHRFLRRSASEREQLVVSRLVVLALGGLAFLMALQSSGFFDISLFAYTLYGVGITPALMAALFWRRATPAGAVASMLTAPAFAIVWKSQELSPWAASLLGQPEGTSVDAVVPSILVAAVVLVVVSLATRPRDEAPEGPQPA